MDRGEMLQAILDYGLDVNTVEYDRARRERALNEAARFVGRKLMAHGLVGASVKSEDFTTLSDTRAYALTATDIVRVFRMVRLDASSREVEEAVQIDERGKMADYVWDGKAWRYYVTRNSTTKLYSINFVGNQGSGITFRVFYHARVAEITAGSGNDTTEYTEIPEEYHDLVVARATFRLTRGDDTIAGSVITDYQELLRQMQVDAVTGASPAEIYSG